MLITDHLNRQEKMSDTEQSIANYFLTHDQGMKELNARKIAGDPYISPSTIVRFCQKLGYSDYETFRMEYLQEVSYLASHFQSVDSNIPFQETDSDWQIANQLGHLYNDSFR